VSSIYGGMGSAPSAGEQADEARARCNRSPTNLVRLMAGLSSTACVTVAYRGKVGLLPANHRCCQYRPPDPFHPTKSQPSWADVSNSGVAKN
jgi:hypothetical protein